MKKKSAKRTKVEWRTKKEMYLWHFVNSLTAGLIFFAGSFTAGGQVTTQGVVTAFLVSLGVAVSKFKEFWTTQKGVYRPALFHFIH